MALQRTARKNQAYVFTWTKAPLAIAFSFLALSPSTVSAQLLNQGVTQQNQNDSFQESISVGGFLRGPNWFFQLPGAAGSPLGSPLNDTGSIGAAFGSGGLSGGLNLQFGQSSTRTSGTTAIGVTSLDGFPGSISSGTVRPFVTSVTPIVGGFPVTGNILVVPDYPEPIDREGIQNQRQLAELRQSQAARQNQKLDLYLQRGEAAQSDQDWKTAIANYRLATSLASPTLKVQLRHRMTALGQQLKQQRRDAKKKKPQ